MYHGLFLDGNLSEYDLSSCDSFTSFKGSQTNLIKGKNVSGWLDLSDCDNLRVVTGENNGMNIKLGKNVTSLSHNQVYGKIDLSLCENLKSIAVWSSANSALGTFDTLNAKAKLNNICFSQGNISDAYIEALKEVDLSEVTYFWLGSYYEPSECQTTNLDYLKNLTKVETLVLSNFKNITDYSFISKLTNLKDLKIRWAKGGTTIDLTQNTLLESIAIYEKCTFGTIKIGNQENLTSLTISGCKNLTSLSGLGKMPNLSIVDLHSNNISDLSGLFNENYTQIKYNSINLSDNNIEGEPVTGAKNLEILEKLYNLGLSTIIITDNAFTLNEINKLQEIFGSDNVMN